MIIRKRAKRRRMMKKKMKLLECLSSVSFLISIYNQMLIKVFLHTQNGLDQSFKQLLIEKLLMLIMDNHYGKRFTHKKMVFQYSILVVNIGLSFIIKDNKLKQKSMMWFQLQHIVIYLLELKILMKYGQFYSLKLLLN